MCPVLTSCCTASAELSIPPSRTLRSAPHCNFSVVALTAEDHNHVLQWAHVVDHQVLRLRQSRAEALGAQSQVRARGIHTARDNEPFHRMKGDAHFVLTACVQFFRALKNFDGNLRLPTHLDESEVRSLRNALEHWDEDDGPGARAMAKLGVDPTSHT